MGKSKPNIRQIRLDTINPSMQVLRSLREEFSGHLVLKCPYDIEIEFTSSKKYTFSDIIRIDWIHTPEDSYSVILTAVRGYGMHTCRLYDNARNVSIVSYGQLIPMSKGSLLTYSAKKSIVRTLTFKDGEGKDSNARVKITVQPDSQRTMPSQSTAAPKSHKRSNTPTQEYTLRTETRQDPFTGETHVVHFRERKH